MPSGFSLYSGAVHVLPGVSPWGATPLPKLMLSRPGAFCNLPSPCPVQSWLTPTACMHEQQQGVELEQDVRSCYSMCGSLHKRIHFHSPACLLQSKYNAAANNILCHSRPQRANAQAVAVGATSLRTAAVLSPYRSPWGCLHPPAPGSPQLALL